MSIVEIVEKFFAMVEKIIEIFKDFVAKVLGTQN